MAEALPDIPHLEVTGSAVSIVEPDLARVTAELKHVDDNASVAKRSVDTQTAALLSLARDCEVATADSTATQLDIGPEHDWRAEGNTYKGTSVSREVTIILRDLSHFPKLLDGLAGIPVHKLRNVTMDTTDRDSVERETLAAAIANAQKVATDIALGLKQQITGVFRVAHSDGRYNDRLFYAAADISSDTFEIGNIEIRARVEITFAIEPEPAS